MKLKGQIKSFLETPEGKLAQYRVRRRRWLVIEMDGIEPQSKKMSAEVKREFQDQVSKFLSGKKRGAFRGHIALHLELATRHPTAPHAHTITKNLLDLLGRQGDEDKSWQEMRLYKDDGQIHALSVSCRHGQEQPTIRIAARPLSAMIDDVELAADAARQFAEEDPGEWYRSEHDWESVNSFKDLIRNESTSRAKLGDKVYEALFKMERWRAQRAFLSASAISLPMLGWLQRRPKGPFMQPLLEPWPELVRKTGLRFQLGELPTVRGSSEAFMQRIDAALAEFQERWGWLITPLVVPVGLQVLVQPNASTPPNTQHDLDNIVRNYLVPKIVPKFGTVTNHVWTLDFEGLKRSAPDLAARLTTKSLPKGTKDGVTGYEVWRLPPAPKGQPGFVSVSFTAQPDVEGDLMQQVDRQIRRWADSVKEKATSHL